MRTTSQVGLHTHSKKHSLAKRVKANWELYLMLIVPVVFVAVFNYAPMYGVLISFQRYNPVLGIMHSPWVGFEQFEKFLKLSDFWVYVWNTFSISALSLLLSFPMPIILAMAFHYCAFPKYKRAAQLITYAPYFISVVVLCGLVLQVLDYRTGIVNVILQALGFDPVNFMGTPSYFKWIYALSGVWQLTGFNSIIYLAALAGVSTELHEAAIIDGATKLQRVWHIDFKSILPTITILLIMNAGSLVSTSYEKILLLQNPLNMTASQTLQTYIYQIGIKGSPPDYSYSTAIGLLVSLVNIALIATVNFISKKLGETSLW